MIEGLKPYAEYKESKVPWIGRVPSDWRVERTKWIFRSRKELNVGRRNTNVLSLTLRGVVNNDPDSPEGMVPKDYATYQLFRKHDLVFKLIDLENICTSRVGLVHEDGIMSSAYVRLAPSKSANIRFFYFQFFDLYTRAVFNALGAGVRSTLGAADLGELRIAIPPPDDQAAIVRFLDHANRKIDGFIRSKRKLIGLLNEQKQAIIHRAVTCGLNPDVPLKASGMDWLGDIPSHWEIVPSKSLFGQRKEKAKTNDRMLTASQAHGIIARDEFMAIEQRRVMHVFTGADILKHVEPNDFVMSMRSFQGGLEWSKVRGAISSAYVMLVPKEHVHPPYYAYFLKCKAYISALRRTSDLVRDGQALRYANFGQVPLPRVPRVEQESITVFLGETVSDSDAAISRTEREISLMQEYRTRLTADLVTGKLDVREAAAHLPAPLAETVEPEVLADETEESAEADEASD